LADARILDVIDLAYQAATDPALWSPTLEGVADIMGGSAAALLTTRPNSSVAIRSDLADLQAYFDYFEAINPIQAGFDRMHLAGETVARPVLSDRDCVDRSELVGGEYYNDFMRRCDHGSAVLITGAAFRIDGSAPAFNVFRPFDKEEFGAAELEAATMLQRPLQRAYQMSRRLARERRLNESLAEFVGQLSGAVFMVAGDGRIAYANAAGEAMLAQRDGLVCEGRRLRASAREAQRWLAALLATATAATSERRRGGSLALPRPSDRRPLALLATPVRGGLDPMGGEPLALVSVTDPEHGGAVPEARLQAYFGFTAAEARVAAELIAGYDGREIADRLARSIHTVRVQIARIHEKTETHRQTEAVALMMRALGVGSLAG
jgi:DNA-binding CsgD family transcriptional regulator/PAS domain-containing protein